MEFRQLQYFIIVAQEKSFSKAAQKAYVSPQAISKAIQNLEAELNAPLFVRHTHGVELTEAGQVLLKKAYSITNLVNDISIDLHVGIKNAENIVLLGLAEGPSDWLDMERLLSFNKLHPGYRISLLLENDNQLESRILSDKLELAIMGSRGTNEKIEFFSLRKSQTFVIVNTRNPLSEKDSISLTDLKDQDFIIGSDDFYGCNRFKTLCNALGFAPRIIHQCHDMNLAINLVNAGEGVFLGCKNIIDYIDPARIKVLPLDNDPRLFDLHLVYKKNVKLSEGAELLKEHIINILSNDI